MRPIEFDEMTGTAAEDQPEYLPLPMFRDDKQVISCWQMGWKERLKVLFTGIIWMRLCHPEDAFIVPSLLEVNKPFQVAP